MPKLGDALILDALRFPIAQQPILVISSWSSLAVTLEVRLVTREGVMDLPHTTNADRSNASDEYRIPNWPICLMARQTAGNPRRGQTFIQIALNLGGHRHVILAQDYIDRHHTLSWPPGRVKSSVEGPGYHLVEVGTNPAADTEISETMPTNSRRRLKAIQFTLVTGVAAANREVVLVINDGTDDIGYWSAGAVQTAGLTRSYIFSPEVSRMTAFDNSGNITVPIPELTLMAGWVITTQTLNRQAADDYGAPRMTLEEWIEE